MNVTVVFLVQAAVVVGVPPIIWYLTPIRRILPLAVLQILTGIALGPSLLGRLSPEAFHLLFPASGFASLTMVANFAVVLFAFALGLHLDAASFAGRGRAFVMLSAGSILVPVGLGVCAGILIWSLYPDAVGTQAGYWEFAAGIGICIGVTALPVLAAILTEMKLLKSRVGQQALGCAAVNDAALWVLLAVLLAVLAEQRGHGTALWVLAVGVSAYVGIMAFVVKPLLSRLRLGAQFSELELILVCTVAFGSAAVTELLGLHMVLGALGAGLVVPRAWRSAVLARIEMMTGVVLLPFFFAITGLRTFIDFGSESFAAILLISSVAAVVGKVLGTAIPARLSGESWNDSLALGALLQTKGLMEVVALTVLLEVGLIAPTTFSAMITMAVLTTAMSVPLARAAWAGRFSRSSAGNVAMKERGIMSDVTVDSLTKPGEFALSILVVSWNDWPKLRLCLTSIMRSALPRAEIIVVDNNSTDGTAERVQAEFPSVRLIRNAQNIGHTRAVNQSFSLATGEYILLLDSDTELRPNCIDILHDYLRAHPEVDLVAPRTFNTDGSIQETARNFPTPLTGLFGRQSLLTHWFPTNPISHRYLARDQISRSVPFAVQQVGGACMFFRRALLSEVGMWDTSYFGYWVDTDWCHRLHSRGRRIMCIPTARIVHHESNARGKRKSVRRIWIFHYGAYQLYTRWHTRGYWDPRAILAGTALLASLALKVTLNAWPVRRASLQGSNLQPDTSTQERWP